MNQSIHSTTPQFEKKKVARFHRLDNEHISAIESLYKTHPFLKDRVEIHMPFHRAKPTFQSGTVWMWPKFDKRPVGYLIFMDGLKNMSIYGNYSLSFLLCFVCLKYIQYFQRSKARILQMIHMCSIVTAKSCVSQICLR